MVGVREIALMIDSFPRSIRWAISTSPSRVSRGTVPICRRYIRTGSLVLSIALGVRSSSPSSERSLCGSRRLFSRCFCSESTTSMPALPNAVNSSSSSSGVVMSRGSSSFISAESRYPFSLPISISCRTSSYRSSSDNSVPPRVAPPHRAAGLYGSGPSVRHQCVRVVLSRSVHALGEPRRGVAHPPFAEESGDVVAEAGAGRQGHELLGLRRYCSRAATQAPESAQTWPDEAHRRVLSRPVGARPFHPTSSAQ